MDTAQASNLILYVSNKPLPWKKVRDLPLTLFIEDWYGARVSAKTGFVLAIDAERIFFFASCAQSPLTKPSARLGQFVSGLWGFDLAELFLCEDGTGRYQEFNLAPNGSWWSAVFSTYRKEAADFSPPRGVETVSHISAHSWKAGLTIPRASLGVNIEFSPFSRLNVSMIISGGARNHLSWARIHSETPDFHRTDEFCTLSLVEI